MTNATALSATRREGAQQKNDLVAGTGQGVLGHAKIIEVQIVSRPARAVHTASLYIGVQISRCCVAYTSVGRLICIGCCVAAFAT